MSLLRDIVEVRKSSPEEMLNMRFYDNVTDAHNGQIDGTLWAIREDFDWDNPTPETVFGKIDWVKYNGVTTIQMIQVNERFRRRGVGTALVRELERLHDNVEWSLTTSEGEALRQAIMRGKDG